jgi:hypothetical protein
MKKTPFGNFKINKEVRETIFGDIELLDFKEVEEIEVNINDFDNEPTLLEVINHLTKLSEKYNENYGIVRL